MGVQVDGQGPQADGTLGAKSQLTAFAIKFNGGKLPLDLASAQVYFPATTVSVTPQGKVVKTDAPDIALPVKLPGLDVKRFPEITYLPIELKGGEIEVGDKWKFTRLFGDSPMNYSCEVQKLDAGRATIAVVVDQSYELLEDETLEIVKNEKDAANRVKTELKGSGTVVFDTSTGRAVSVEMKNHSVSQVRPIEGGKPSERVLDSSLSMKLKSPIGSSGTATVPTAQSTPKAPPSLWDRAVQKVQGVWSEGQGYIQLARLMLGMAAAYMPGLGPVVKLILGS